MKQIILKDIVQDTYTNVSGASLSIQIKDDLIKDHVIQISLKDSSPMSSSFFNSSFGDLIESFGYQTIKNRIKFTEVTASQAKLLRSYFDAYKDYCNA